jgi:hypothetical protein
MDDEAILLLLPFLPPSSKSKTLQNPNSKNATKSIMWEKTTGWGRRRDAFGQRQQRSTIIPVKTDQTLEGAKETKKGRKQ